MNARKDISLILGLSIPVLMILFVAGSIYLPGLFAQPKFSFLYTIKGNSRYGCHYSVQSGRLIKSEVKYPGYYRGARLESKLYIHNVVKNKSKEISFDEARKLTLNSNSQSPDGFEVDCGRRDQGIFSVFIGSSRDCSTRFIKGHNTSRKLNVQLPGSRYHYDYEKFQFLGWIIE